MRCIPVELGSLHLAIEALAGMGSCVFTLTRVALRWMPKFCGYEWNSSIMFRVAHGKDNNDSNGNGAKKHVENGWSHGGHSLLSYR